MASGLGLSCAPAVAPAVAVAVDRTDAAPCTERRVTMAGRLQTGQRKLIWTRSTRTEEGRYPCAAGSGPDATTQRPQPRSPYLFPRTVARRKSQTQAAQVQWAPYGYRYGRPLGVVVKRWTINYPLGGKIGTDQPTTDRGYWFKIRCWIMFLTASE